MTQITEIARSVSLSMTNYAMTTGWRKTRNVGLTPRMYKLGLNDKIVFSDIIPQHVFESAAFYVGVIWY